MHAQQEPEIEVEIEIEERKQPAGARAYMARVDFNMRAYCGGQPFMRSGCFGDNPRRRSRCVAGCGLGW